MSIGINNYSPAQNKMSFGMARQITVKGEAAHIEESLKALSEDVFHHKYEPNPRGYFTLEAKKPKQRERLENAVEKELKGFYGNKIEIEKFTGEIEQKEIEQKAKGEYQKNLSRLNNRLSKIGVDEQK